MVCYDDAPRRIAYPAGRKHKQLTIQWLTPFYTSICRCLGNKKYRFPSFDYSCRPPAHDARTGGTCPSLSEHIQFFGTQKVMQVTCGWTIGDASHVDNWQRFVRAPLQE